MKKQTERLATISVEKELVGKIKIYCSIRGLKIRAWAEQALIKVMKEKE